MKRGPVILAALFCFLWAGPARAVEIHEVLGRKSGVRAWLVEEHKLPIVAMHFAFQGGSEQDPEDKQGLANLAMAALTQGAGPYDAEAFQKILADRSIYVGFGAGRDELTGGLKCLSVDKDQAFELLRLAMTKPRFAKKDIERLRAQQLTGIRQQFSDPEWQARYALLSHVFAGHPYRFRRLGTTQTLQALTRDDLSSFVAGHFARDTVTVAVAGDMTPDELSLLLDKVFGDLPARAKLKPVDDVVERPDAPLFLIERDGAQTEILWAVTGPKRDDPDYYAALVANYILGGGGFSSRLMQDMRDKNGLTYGVSTDLAPSEHAGLVVGEVAVDNAKVSQALSLIRETLRRFRDDGPTDKEIEAAKDYLTGSMPLALTSTDKIAAILVAMQRENLGMDYLDRYGTIIRSVSKKAIGRALDRFFDPDKMTTVMVGKPEGSLPAQKKDMVLQ